MKNNDSKKMFLGVIGFVILIFAFVLIYNLGKEATSTGEKKIKVDVILADGTTTSHTIQTDAEYLRQALEEKELIQGTESEYGLYVLTVNNVTANIENQEWWAFTKNSESLMTGVDDTPINDGDHFEIILTVGY